MHRFKVFIFLVASCIALTCSAQDEGDENELSVDRNGLRGFHVGFYAGVLFPNDYSSSLYDGYGVDTGGNKNSFVKSAMVQRMVAYGLDSVNTPALHYSYGYPDQIGPAIGVTSHDLWRFDSTDMPVVEYKPAFLFGLQFQYGISRTEGIVLNTYFSKVNVTGTFTIRRDRLINPGLGDSILYFGLTGQEQRFNLQLGYSRLIGNPNNVFGFIVEGGLLFNSTKWLNNYANINDLQLDLTPFTFNQGYQNDYLPPEYNAVGYGAFAGLGLNISTMNYLVQLMYSPSYEKIGIGEAPEAKVQHALGLRVYYGL